jgi:hypothetical protein
MRFSIGLPSTLPPAQKELETTAMGVAEFCALRAEAERQDVSLHGFPRTDVIFHLDPHAGCPSTTISALPIGPPVNR